jgi:hypothetical protein
MIPELETDSKDTHTLSSIDEILKEMEILKRVHLQALFSVDEAETGKRSVKLDESAIKQTASYLKLAEKMVRILERRDKLKRTVPLEDAPLHIVMEVLRYNPVIRDALATPGVRKQITELLKKKLAQEHKTE